MLKLIERLFDSVRRGDFTDSTKVEAQELSLHLLELRERRSHWTVEDHHSYLRGICIQSEIFDYYGDFENARAVIEEDGARASEDLKDQISVSRPAALYIQMIWVLVHFAHTIYRKGQLLAAEKQLRGCQEHLESLCRYQASDYKLVDPAFGLRSRISYSLARVARQLGRLGDARTLYADAMRHQYQRLERKILIYSGVHKRLASEQAYTNYAIAKCMGFGLAWISLRSGELTRAHASLSAARALLCSTKDEVHKGYVDLLYAQALRARANGTTDDLIESRRILHRLVFESAAFSEVKNYMVRAQLELARTYTFMGDADPKYYQEAKEQIKRVLGTMTMDHHDDRPWRFYAAILLSRIRRSEASAESGASKESAGLRIKLANKSRSLALYALRRYSGGESSIRYRAGVALAEVYIQDATFVRNAKRFRSDELFDEAQKYLVQAADLASGNRLDVGVCHLHLARISARRGDFQRAIAEFQEWKKLAPDIENGFVLKLEREVRAEVFVEGAFILTADSWPFKYEDTHDALRGWLLDQAKIRLGTHFVRDAHKSLGISRGTFFAWRDKLRPSRTE
jgi:tetratricopeptide (TPR) repeat protein